MSHCKFSICTADAVLSNVKFGFCHEYPPQFLVAIQLQQPGRNMGSAEQKIWLVFNMQQSAVFIYFSSCKVGFIYRKQCVVMKQSTILHQMSKCGLTEDPSQGFLRESTSMLTSACSTNSTPTRSNPQVVVLIIVVIINNSDSHYLNSHETIEYSLMA